MENTAFLEELKSLTSQEDLLSVNREVNELKVKFEDYIIEEERKLQVAQLEAQENGTEIPENPELFQLKEMFYETVGEYKTKRKALVEERNAVEATNLAAKRSLISKLKELVEKEENIGAAFGELKTIQEKWKQIGDIPRDKRDDVQAEYSKLMEDFFYNINIYKQLKEHDLHRNSQMKNAVVDQLAKLEKVESIREVEHQLKALQNDWEDIGPVTNEEWEALKEKYWSLVRLNYDRINQFYEERRSQLQDNLAKKQALLDHTKSFVSELPENLSQKDWEEKTAELLKIQEDWKKIGFGPKKENEEVWQAFRTQCDTFFSKKKEFYGSLQSKFDAVAEKKKEVIKQAEELAGSTDWKNAANKLKQLQSTWKKLGHSGQRHEQKLWKEFRANCDAFFNARQAHFDAAEAEFEGNLTSKNELISKIEAYKPSEDKKETLAQLKEFANEFSAIGKVPMKQKDEVFDRYKKALDQHYAAIKLEGAEKERVLFEARLDTIAGSPNASNLFSREKQDLRNQIDKIKSDIIQLENNLGFFANSKGADSLKAEVEKKISKANEQIDSIKMKIKMIPNE